MNPEYTEKDLLEAAVFMGAVKLTEAVLKNDFRFREIVEELATKIAEWRSEARAGMREACANKIIVFSTLGDGSILQV